MVKESEWLTIPEAAERLGLTPMGVRRYVKRGLLIQYKNPISRAVRVKAADIERIARERGEFLPMDAKPKR